MSKHMQQQADMKSSIDKLTDEAKDLHNEHKWHIALERAQVVEDD